jgi:CubicO group peptidase (beta-lactamase class C family)
MPDGPGRHAEIHGLCDPRFDRVRAVFTEHFSRGEEVGGAICVFHGDELVVDLWGGVADRRTGRPWHSDTPCLVFSCTKALTAVCALHLWEQGRYEMDGPVAAWWPEFATAGKDVVTAAHLLSHQGGLPALDTPVSVADAADAGAVAAMLAAQEPVWEPGTAHGYHALTFGWLAGEIVRRLSGQRVGDYLAEHVTGPHKLDIWLGAPDGVIERAARVTTRPPDPPRSDTAPTDTARTGPPRADAPGEDAAGEQAAPGASGPPARPAARPPARSAADLAAALGGPSNLLIRSLYNPDTTSVRGGSNSPSVLRGGWPASGAVSSAAALAAFYRHLIAGRIIDPGTLQAAITPRVSGPDRVMGVDSAFGLGFMRPAVMFLTPPAGAASAFGHTGFGGSVGLGDVSRGIAMAYVPNRLAGEMSAGLRAYRLAEAVYASVS